MADQPATPETTKEMYKYTGTEYVRNDQVILTDPDGRYGSPDAVQAHYAQTYADLAQATYFVEPPESADKPRRVIFNKAVGRKG